MKQMHVPGVIINEHSPRDREIQLDLEDLLNMVARAHYFNWQAPTHDIVRRLMNEVHEFRPAEEE
ncbi:hypothetical protein ES703_11086 [subsurface metagenome]